MLTFKSIIALIAILWMPFGKSFGQAQELEELALDLEKLAQFKQILSDLKQGYEILSTGYNTIRDLSHGNFSLHKDFLDKLLQINPAMASIASVSDIIAAQKQLISEYKAAWNTARRSGRLTSNELSYVLSVYENLIKLSAKDISALLDLITPAVFRMSDHERVTAVDRIAESVNDKLNFLRVFNAQLSVLVNARKMELHDIDQTRALYNNFP